MSSGLRLFYIVVLVVAVDFALYGVYLLVKDLF